MILMIITIDFKKMDTKELRELTLNYNELSALGKTMLDGADRAEFHDQFVVLYKGNTRVYELGFTYFNNEEYTNDDGTFHVNSGYELIG